MGSVFGQKYFFKPCFQKINGKHTFEKDDLGFVAPVLKNKNVHVNFAGKNRDIELD